MNNQERRESAEFYREKTCGVLERAFSQGVIDVDEYEGRVKQALAADSMAEFLPLVSDLPMELQREDTTQQHTQKSTPSEPVRKWRWKPFSLLLALFSGSFRKREWNAPKVLLSLSIFGGSAIDFQKAALPPGTMTITVVSLFGGGIIKMRGYAGEMERCNMLLVSVFGGQKVTIDWQEPPRGGMNIGAVSIFGGSAITVSDTMSVDSDGIGLFGGAPHYTKKNNFYGDGATVRVRTLAVFGGTVAGPLNGISAE
jgi:hypothetical protein